MKQHNQYSHGLACFWIRQRMGQKHAHRHYGGWEGLVVTERQRTMCGQTVMRHSWPLWLALPVLVSDLWSPSADLSRCCPAERGLGQERLRQTKEKNTEEIKCYKSLKKKKKCISVLKTKFDQVERRLALYKTWRIPIWIQQRQFLFSFLKTI